MDEEQVAPGDLMPAPTSRWPVLELDWSQSLNSEQSFVFIFGRKKDKINKHKTALEQHHLLPDLRTNSVKSLGRDDCNQNMSK